MTTLSLSLDMGMRNETSPFQLVVSEFKFLSLLFLFNFLLFLFFFLSSLVEIYVLLILVR